jgi:hypothetical protein
MCQGTCPFCFTLINLPLVLQTALNQLNFSIIVRLQVKFALIKIFMWAVKDSFANRCPSFPLSPVEFLLVKVLHNFLSIEFL